MKRIAMLVLLVMGVMLFGTGYGGAIDIEPARDVIAIATFSSPEISAYQVMFIDNLGDIYRADMTAQGYNTCGEIIPQVLRLPEEFRTGHIDRDAVQTIQSLANAADENGRVRYATSAVDAGDYAMTVFKRDAKGEEYPLRLMASGDVIYENLSPAALHLQDMLRGYFPPEEFLPPELTAYGLTLPTYIAYSADDGAQYVMERAADAATLEWTDASGRSASAALDYSGLAALRDIFSANMPARPADMPEVQPEARAMTLGYADETLYIGADNAEYAALRAELGGFFAAQSGRAEAAD